MNHDPTITADASSASPIARNNWHYCASLGLGIALIPVLRHLSLPIRFDWITYGVAFWFLLSAQAIFLAALLAVIGMPREQALGPLLDRFRQNPARAVALLVFFLILTFATSLPKALVLTVDAVAVIELLNREKAHGLRRAATSVFPAATYLFFGFLMVLAYTCAIVSVRFNFAMDPTFATWDRHLLAGHSVSELAHWAVRTFPLWFFRALELVYFGMFPQIGAALVIAALCGGRRRALQFVGTILTSYYLALIIFYVWTSQGPYVVCPDHFARFPASLQVYKLQKTLIYDAMALWQHRPITRISTDYFIGMPCMHIAQPLVVIWFLRRWRRIVLVLAAYDVLLVAAILLLEQHYVVDVLGGIVVAGLAIAISGGPLRRHADDPLGNIA